MNSFKKKLELLYVLVFSNKVLIFILNFIFEMFLSIFCTFDFNSSCVILRVFLPTAVIHSFSLNLLFELESRTENL